MVFFFRFKMVAGLTADVFVQLTATLAHLSQTLNKTNTKYDNKLVENDLFSKGKNQILALTMKPNVRVYTLWQLEFLPHLLLY